MDLLSALSCWFLAWFTLQPWRWRPYIPPKGWMTSNYTVFLYVQLYLEHEGYFAQFPYKHQAIKRYTIPAGICFKTVEVVSIYNKKKSLPLVTKFRKDYIHSLRNCNVSPSESNTCGYCIKIILSAYNIILCLYLYKMHWFINWAFFQWLPKAFPILESVRGMYSFQQIRGLQVCVYTNINVLKWPQGSYYCN
jgi:hypothetical protein